MTNLLVLIKSAIDEKLRWKNCSSFYIGKTDDFENRKIDHIQNQNENYTFCWELAYGTPKQISELENELISFYQSSKFKNILQNENKGSAGNPKADTLYVAFKYNDTIDFHELYDDAVEIKESFPLNLQIKEL